jgi:hypothetical protein
MHHLMLTTLQLPKGVISSAARLRAHDILSDDDSFVANRGLFVTPLCDSFVIGGRWSGLLKMTLLGEPYQAAFKREFRAMAKDGYSSSFIAKNRDRLNELWREFGGTDDNPLTRGRYDHGHDDDAMLVDHALYQNLLGQYCGKRSQFEGDSCTFTDLDGETVDESFIGRKWLVVVDYHT